MIYHCWGLGVYRERRINISSDNFIVARAIKTTGAGWDASQEIQLQRAVQLEKIVEFISFRQPGPVEPGKGVKTSAVLNGERKEIHDMTAIF